MCGVFTSHFFLLFHHLHSHFFAVQLVGVQQVFCASENLFCYSPISQVPNIRRSFGMAQKKMRQRKKKMVCERIHGIFWTQRGWTLSFCNRHGRSFSTSSLIPDIVACCDFTSIAVHHAAYATSRTN